MGTQAILSRTRCKGHLLVQYGWFISILWCTVPLCHLDSYHFYFENKKAILCKQHTTLVFMTISWFHWIFQKSYFLVGFSAPLSQAQGYSRKIILSVYSAYWTIYLLHLLYVKLAFSKTSLLLWSSKLGWPASFGVSAGNRLLAFLPKPNQSDKKTDLMKSLYKILLAQDFFYYGKVLSSRIVGSSNRDDTIALIMIWR